MINKIYYLFDKPEDIENFDNYQKDNFEKYLKNFDEINIKLNYLSNDEL